MSHVQNLQMLRSNNYSLNSKNSSLSPYEKNRNRIKLDNLTTLKLNLQTGRETSKKLGDFKSASSKRNSARKADILPEQRLLVNDARFNEQRTSVGVRDLGIRIGRRGHLSIPLTERRQTDSPIKNQIAELNFPKITKTKFKTHYVVGKGGFGKVWKVEMQKTGKIYAMKQMYKTKIINKKSINSVMNEKQLLSQLNHPLLVNMSYAFQDKENLYLIMDYLNGGDLRYHLVIKRRFSQNQSKFFIACLLLCIQYLHSHQIIHRDIKPQNLVLDNEGYLKLTDLGISRKLRQQNGSDTSGTPGYMAPEVMCHKNHSFAADYFAIGVLAYEMMIGKRPYLGRDRKQIRQQILSRQAVIKVEDIPIGWSLQSADFINKLLQRNPENRLGSNSGQQVKKHPWIKNVDWGKILRRQIKAPFVPISIEDNYSDYKQQISQDTIIQNPQQNALLLRQINVKQLFKGYQYTTSSKSLGSTSSTQQSHLNDTDELFNRILKDSLTRF